MGMVATNVQKISSPLQRYAKVSKQATHGPFLPLADDAASFVWCVVRKRRCSSKTPGLSTEAYPMS
jgi:hypothetical protein